MSPPPPHTHTHTPTPTPTTTHTPLYLISWDGHYLQWWCRFEYSIVALFCVHKIILPSMIHILVHSIFEYTWSSPLVALLGATHNERWILMQADLEKDIRWIRFLLWPPSLHTFRGSIPDCISNTYGLWIKLNGGCSWRGYLRTKKDTTTDHNPVKNISFGCQTLSLIPIGTTVLLCHDTQVRKVLAYTWYLEYCASSKHCLFIHIHHRLRFPKAECVQFNTDISIGRYSYTVKCWHLSYLRNQHRQTVVSPQ